MRGKPVAKRALTNANYVINCNVTDVELLGELSDRFGGIGVVDVDALAWRWEINCEKSHLYSYKMAQILTSGYKMWFHLTDWLINYFLLT